MIDNKYNIQPGDLYMNNYDSYYLVLSVVLDSSEQDIRLYIFNSYSAEYSNRLLLTFNDYIKQRVFTKVSK